MVNDHFEEIEEVLFPFLSFCLLYLCSILSIKSKLHNFFFFFFKYWILWWKKINEEEVEEEALKVLQEIGVEIGEMAPDAPSHRAGVKPSLTDEQLVAIAEVKFSLHTLLVLFIIYSFLLFYSYVVYNHFSSPIEIFLSTN